MKRLQQLLIGCVLLTSLVYAQRATNGQQVLFGGIRFDRLEVTGLNQDKVLAAWKSWGQFPPGGATAAYVEGWWWKGDVKIQASFNDHTVLTCTAGPLDVGFYIVVVSAQAGKCQGEATNANVNAQQLERWLRQFRTQVQLQAAKTMLLTANDAWQCLNSLALKVANPDLKCAGVATTVLQQLQHL